jgi:hypothetical protein
MLMANRQFRAFLIYIIIAVLSITYTAATLVYYYKDIEGELGFPEEVLDLKVQTNTRYLDGAVYADGRGKYIIASSTSDVLRPGTYLQVLSNDTRVKKAEVKVGQGTIAYPGKEGDLFVSISIPSISIRDPVYLEGYIVIPAQVAMLSGHGSFYYEKRDVNSKQFRISMHSRKDKFKMYLIKTIFYIAVCLSFVTLLLGLQEYGNLKKKKTMGAYRDRDAHR